jgi:hypothetical protein
MGTATAVRRPRRQVSDERKAEIAKRYADIDQAAEAINDDEPDFREFLARWGTRYNVNNLRRLWVQYPRATCLHKFGTWQGMGRQVRKGEKAIYLMHPRTGTDPDKVSPENPNGEVFYGASWMALFDYAQTDPIGEFTDQAPADADPGLVAEVKRLRTAALAEHPDVAAPNTGPADAAFQAACQKFAAAWKRYEDARDRLKGDTRP